MWRTGKLVIDQEGREQKMIDTVEQITFSGAYANKTGQPVMYITERAVFELRSDGVYLTEVAPGIDVQKQVVDQMGFTPKMEAGGPRLMDARIFAEGLWASNKPEHQKNGGALRSGQRKLPTAGRCPFSGSIRAPTPASSY